MERNRKCNIAGILFTLLLIYETYSYVMFLKVLSEFDVETVWTRLYFCSYADGSEWVMIIGKLFAICSLIIMITSSFRLTKARIGMRKKTAIVYFLIFDMKIAKKKQVSLLFHLTINKEKSPASKC